MPLLDWSVRCRGLGHGQPEQAYHQPDRSLSFKCRRSAMVHAPCCRHGEYGFDNGDVGRTTHNIVLNHARTA